jgi:hypothetical protein
VGRQPDVIPLRWASRAAISRRVKTADNAIATEASQKRAKLATGTGGALNPTDGKGVSERERSANANLSRGAKPTLIVEKPLLELAKNVTRFGTTDLDGPSCGIRN